MALPPLSNDDRRAALEKAAAARKARAELRVQIKNGEISVEDVLNKADDPVVGRMRVSMFIESLPGYGKAKASRLMEELKISPSRRIQGLGTRQREVLLERLSK